MGLRRNLKMKKPKFRRVKRWLVQARDEIYIPVWTLLQSPATTQVTKNVLWEPMLPGAHATWHSEATGTTQEAICSDTFLEPAGQVTSTLELSVGLVPLRWMLSQKHQLHWNPRSLRQGGTHTRDLTWDNMEDGWLGETGRWVEVVDSIFKQR